MTKIYSLRELQATINENPKKWRPLVLTNGCFDLLHVGHVRYLQIAKSLGKSLVVGVNSDQSVRQIKPQPTNSPPRPIIPEQQRTEVLAALTAVDAAVVFSETTAVELIKALQPDIYAKGGDYTLESLPEAKTTQSYGGKIELITVEIPTSTSEIIRKISCSGS
ncbi:adenylyltransferase/cytidyltransferase family protein [Euhalothece natronophila Z-M001]|uniref:Adenylyltransferase/cytidyltransferase family protein n=1 Tax=Euhalothece natronophila Z-M001 TaxID=522448 RepID=A0A5B8NMI6_9CHRO|nr:adenylyltransferase/cytidyltransferase family protein [Euhalothece natronophila]QDZ40502.1 adenylyltransferase/cytidyltransferase family protein [Euhalothece natronophila Z-M001]